MPECICPSCKTLFSASSSEFGENYRCNSCGAEFALDVVHLAHYQLPNIIRIQLQNIDGTPFIRFSIPVIVDYGYKFPPLQSDSLGQVLIKREMFSKAQRDEISTGMMDYRGDYSLNRFIRIKVLGRSDAIEVSNARIKSGWPILDFEKELYTDMPSLIAAYVPIEDIVPVEANIDIAKEKDVVDLDLIIETL